MYNLYSKLTTAFAAFAIIFSTNVSAQCVWGDNVYGDASPALAGDVANVTCAWAGESYSISVVAGETYQISALDASYDTQLTLFDGAQAVLAFNDDYSGSVQSYIEYVADADGTVYVQLNEWNCITNGTCTPISVTWLSNTTCDDATACNFGEAGSCTYAAEGFDCNGVGSIDVVCGTPSVGSYIYENNDQTSWVVTAPEGEVVEIAFSGSVENNWDWITINGVNTYTGSLDGIVYVSESNTVTFGVNSDGSVSGFEFGWSVGCLTTCTDDTACNFGEEGTCTFAIEGFDCAGNCLSGTFVEYVPGSCCAGEHAFTITDCAGNLIASMNSGFDGFSSCVELPTDYVLTLTDSFADSWDGASLSIGGESFTMAFSDGAEASFTTGTCACDDDTACNFGEAGLCTYAAEGFDCDGVGSVDVVCGTPSVGSYTYENNDATYWVVTAPEGEVVEIAFSGSVENNWDWITINGVDTYTGALDGVVYVADGNTMTFGINSDGSVSGYTFGWSVDCATACTDATACNFGEEGTCTYASPGLNCDGNVEVVCGEISTGSYNYGNADDTEFGVVGPEGSVLVVTFNGFVETNWDQLLVNGEFFADGNLDGLTYVAEGNEFNFGINSDGSVNFEFGWSIECLVCDDESACNFGAEGVVCDYSCIGCMDPLAANYDPLATLPGACINCNETLPGALVLTVEMEDSYGDGWNGASYYIYDDNGAEVASGNLDNALNGDGSFSGFDLVCMLPGCYSIDVTQGTSPSEVSMTLLDQFGTVYGSVGGGQSLDINFLLGGNCEIEGCTNEAALNYNINASIDDGSCEVPPANDLLENAEAVTCGMMTTGTLQYAIDDQQLANTSVNGVNNAGVGVWYQFNATMDQQVTVSTCDTPSNELATDDYISDTKLFVYTLEDGELTAVTANDDACGLRSTAVFSAEVGADYYVYVGRYSTFSSGNDFVLSVDCVDCDAIPSNDACDNAIAQVSGITFTGSTCCANSDYLSSQFGGSLSGFASAYAVWFTFNSGDYDTFDFNVTNVGNEMIGLAIYGGTCDELTYIGSGEAVSNVTGSIEQLTTLVPNTDYYFAVWNEDPSQCGEFEFSTTGVYLGCMDAAATNYDASATMEDGSCQYEGVVPANDLCENAVTIECNTSVTGSTGGATSMGAPVTDCDAAPGAGVWYTFVGDGQLHTLSTCGSDIDSKMNIYSTDVACGGASIDVPPVDACGDDVTVNLLFNSSDYYASEISYAVVNAAGDTVLTSPVFSDTFTGTVDTQSACLAPGDYTLAMGDSWGDGWDGASLSLANGLGETIVSGTMPFGPSVFEPITLTVPFTVSPYSTEPSMQPGEYTCEASVATDLVGCGFVDADDASYEFISTPGTLYYIYVGAESFDGLFNLNLDCEPVIEGCQNELACNYNADANFPGDCDFLSCVCADDSGVAVMLDMEDSYGDGWGSSTYTISNGLGEVVLSGSLNDALYQVDEDNITGADYGFDTACLAPGCYTMTVGGGNWDSEITWSLSLADGSIVAAGDWQLTNAPSQGAFGTYVQVVDFTIGDAVCGCTDSTACNYDELATSNDGSCDYDSCSGCTDSAATNYDEDATIDDNTCCYDNFVTVTMFDAADNGWTGGYFSISSVDGTLIDADVTIGANENGTTVSYCLADGCYIIESVGGSNSFDMSWEIVGAFGGIVAGGADDSAIFNVGSGDECVVGCAIACACNYNENANIADNDLCVFDGCSGCTYPDASNYDETAIADNGTCEFEFANPCPADLNGDGSITTGDLLIFLGAFGTICE